MWSVSMVSFCVCSLSMNVERMLKRWALDGCRCPDRDSPKDPDDPTKMPGHMKLDDDPSMSLVDLHREADGLTH